MARKSIRPDEYVNSVLEVDYERLWHKGIRGLLFDIDNTLATYDNPNPGDEIVRLFELLKGMGFQLWIISNGRKERVLEFAAKLQVEAVWRAAKPFGSGVRRAREKMGLESREIAILGDQIFTDVLNGNLEGVHSILIKPISEEVDEWITRPKRGLEKRLIKRFRLRLKSVWKDHRDHRSVFPVDGKTGLLGVMGDPIEHTLSPMLHSLFNEHRGDNFVYVPLHVKPDDLETAVKGCFAMGYTGLNVTIPHKQHIMKYVETLDDSAKLAGAVNTLQRNGNGYKGYNTDIDGVIFLLKVNKVDIRGKKVLILGAGGAARGALAACYRQQAGEVVVFNRTREKAEAMINEFSKVIDRPFAMRVVGTEELASEEFPIVIQSTAAGLYPNVDQLPEGVPERLYEHIKWGLDMVFKPLETAFCKKIKGQGGQADNGLPMLFYQAVKAYEIWTGARFYEKDLSQLYARFLLAVGRLQKHE